MGLFYILNMVVATWIYTSINTHMPVHQKNEKSMLIKKQSSVQELPALEILPHSSWHLDSSLWATIGKTDRLQVFRQTADLVRGKWSGSWEARWRSGWSEINRLPDISPEKIFFSFNFLKMGLFGISRELQFGVQEPCASLCKGREEDCFYRGQRKLGSLCKTSVAFLGWVLARKEEESLLPAGLC